MKTTDMFLSADERKSGNENIPIVLSISKTAQGQVLSPHVVSLRPEKIYMQEKAEVQKNIKNIRHANITASEYEDEILSSISELFRGKNARVDFKNETEAPSKSYDHSSGIPSQKEQIQKMKEFSSMQKTEKGFLQSWFGRR